MFVFLLVEFLSLKSVTLNTGRNFPFRAHVRVFNLKGHLLGTMRNVNSNLNFAFENCAKTFKFEPCGLHSDVECQALYIYNLKLNSNHAYNNLRVEILLGLLGLCWNIGP